MSYARFGWEGSDVYVYEDYAGYYTCCWCVLDVDPKTPSAAIMVEHLREHIVYGHTVPAQTIDAILADGDVEVGT